MDLNTRQSRFQSGSRALAVTRRAVPADFSGVQSLVLAFASRLRGPSPRSGRTLAVKGQKLSLGDDQIGQRKEDVQLGRVLLQPLVANLAMAEEILHDVKGVLVAAKNRGNLARKDGGEWLTVEVDKKGAD